MKASSPPPVLVTGGTGFVGAHLVRALLERGDRVRCLVRATSARENLEGLEIDLVEGDLRRPESLDPAVRGCRAVFHCAADYRLYVRDPRELYDSNVEGTRNLFAAATEAGVEEVIYTSSVGALGLEAHGVPATESTPVSLDRMIGHYKRSKFLAERVAEGFAEHLRVVIVHPSTPVGELDRKPTPTGQIILDYLNGRMPAYVDTGLNLIDVRDVARGHLLAQERGTSGEKYILGHRNLTLKEILDLLAAITGGRPVRWRVPHALPFLVAVLDTAQAKVRGRAPRVSLESVRMSRYRMFFDAEKARRDLGLPQSPVEDALTRAVDFYREHGYADV